MKQVLQNRKTGRPFVGEVPVPALQKGRVLVRTVASLISAGTESRVFEKFFRSHGERPERGRGIGLGLAICRAIVEAHGGTITAANRVGRDGAAIGAVFRFTLPQRKDPPVVDATG